MPEFMSYCFILTFNRNGIIKLNLLTIIKLNYKDNRINKKIILYIHMFY